MGFVSRQPTAITGYIVAIAAVALAAGVRLVFGLLVGSQAPYFAFVLAVIFAAWYGGLRPGILATVLGGVLGFFLLRYGVEAPPSSSSSTILTLCLYSTIGITV